MREVHLAAVQARLQRVAARGSLEPVLEPEAIAEARRLESVLDDGDGDVYSRLCLGWLHYYRVQALPDEQQEQDLNAALVMLSHCFVAGAEGDVLPEPLLQQVAVVAVGTAMRWRDDVLADPADAAFLSATVRLWQRILDAIPVSHGLRAMLLADLGLLFLVRFERAGEVADLEAGIEVTRAGLEACGNARERTACLKTLGEGLLARFERIGELEDLDAAVDDLRAAAEVASDDDLARAACLASLGNALKERFRRLGMLADIDAAVRTGQAAVAAVPAGHPYQAGSLNNLGLALVTRFQRTRALPDLEAAIHAAQAAVTATPGQHPDRPGYLSNLSLALHARFERFEEPEDLEAAINAARAALEALPPGSPRRPAYLENLGTFLRTRFGHAAAPADLEEAIEVLEAGVAATPADDPYLASTLEKLANALRNRFERTGTLADLGKAVDASRAAVAGTPSDDPARAARLVALAAALKARFLRTGALPDLEEAMSAFETALAATPDDHPNRVPMLSNLGMALLTRFERTGALPDLQQAISIGRAVMTAASTGASVTAFGQSLLGRTLLARFEVTGEPPDLDEAIGLLRASVTNVPANEINRMAGLNGLGYALRVRFVRTGSLPDLQEAIRMLETARRVTTADHPQQATVLSNLGVALRLRFERLGALADLDEAIAAGRAAVAALPSGHPDLQMDQNNLANALRVRFDHAGELADLEAAIETFQAAATATPLGHKKRAGRLSNLGIAMQLRFGRTGVLTDLEQAIRMLECAAAEAPADSAARAVALINLAGALEDRFARTREQSDRDRAISGYASATAMTSLAPWMRVLTARAAAAVMAPADPGRAAGLLENAVMLLPEVTPRHLGRDDQQHALGGLAGLANDAAALVLARSGIPSGAQAERALALLEAGRAVLLSQALDTRSDLTDLRKQHPRLAARFEDLRAQFDNMPDPATDTTGAITEADRRQLAGQTATTLERIRALDGFASFGLPPATQELLGQASSGPVVIFNVSSYRSDALLLTSSNVTSIELPGLTYDAVTSRIDSFRDALQAVTAPGASPADWISAQDGLRETLEWLWDTAAEPVLDALGYLNGPAPDRDWPRVWWVPGGLLSCLPLHAAGYHTDPARPSRTVMDRVVSSYAPTVRALRYAREHAAAAEETATRGLIVAMPTTPGISGRLTHVLAEASRVRSRLPCAVVLTEPDNITGMADLPENVPTKASVIARLPDSHIAHFACHGAIDPANPSDSMLLLHDHNTSPLTVASLTPVKLNRAQLAYLSACHTAFTSPPHLVDEAIHLTSAFLLAGFPRVVGTLWAINDAHALEIADAFYGDLATASEGIDTKQAAQALHRAIRALRDEQPATPYLWAAYMHAGA